jgi:hypothetical protein
MRAWWTAIGLGVLLLAGLPTGALPVRAQPGVRSPAATGTGGGTAAPTAGTAALYTNPAFLTAGADAPRVTATLFRVTAVSGGDLLQFDPYRALFLRRGRRPLSDAEEAAVLDDWFGGETRSTTAAAAVVPVALTYRAPSGRWAVGGAVRGRVVQHTAMDQGALDLLLRGTGPDRVVPINGRTRLYGLLDLTGAVSYRVGAGPLSVGVAPRLLLGTGYADGVLRSEAVVMDGTLIHRFDYRARAAGALSTGLYDTFDAFGPTPLRRVLGTTPRIVGVGGGLDVGLSYALRPGLHVSASVTDLGRVRWTGAAQTVRPTTDTFRFEGLSLDPARLSDDFDGDVAAYAVHQVDSLARAAYRDVTRERAPFRTGLPTTAHLQGTWAAGPVVVTGGGTLGLNPAAGAPRALTLHLGGEVRLGPVPLRVGVRGGQGQALSVAGGLGLAVGGVRLDVGGSVTPRSALLGAGARYAAGVSLGWVRR